VGVIISAGELVEDSVGSILEHTAADGKNDSAKYHNLDIYLRTPTDCRRTSLANAAP
jgi:hypothetical protein